MSANTALHILAIAGSLRKDSFNRRLLAAAVQMAGISGAETDLVEPDQLQLPLYNADIESSEGIPLPVVALQERIARADGLLIACPEYNHSIPGVLKNAIDWVSRPPGNPFPDKIAALLGASTGASGAIRALAHLRQVLTSRGVWGVPAQVTVPRAGEAISGDGEIVDDATRQQIGRSVAQLLEQVRRVRGD